MQLILRKVNKSYKNTQSISRVIHNLNINLNIGDTYCLFGPSGCGKTTLLNIISGIIKFDSGNILWKDGKEITRYLPGNKKVGYLFQGIQLFPWLNVQDNLAIALSSLNLSKRQRGDLIIDNLKSLDLIKYIYKYPYSLSQGQQQRIALVRALIINPDILLLDEPFSHLDEEAAQKLREDLTRLIEDKKILTLYVTHNPYEAIYMSNKIIVFNGDTPTKIALLQTKYKPKKSVNNYLDISSDPEVVRSVKKLYKLTRK